jgi:sarcosine oxidase subunit delta
VFRIPCPHCGLRNVTEFRHVGERTQRPDAATAPPESWRRYLYDQRNVAGWSAETWYHGSGCRTFLSVERHTVTNEVRAATAPGGEALPAAPAVDSGAPDAGGAPA